MVNYSFSHVPSRFQSKFWVARTVVLERNLEVEAGTGGKEWRKEGRGIGRETTRPALVEQEVEPRGLITGGGTLPLCSLVCCNASTLATHLPVPLALFLLKVALEMGWKDGVILAPGILGDDGSWSYHR